MKKRVVAIVGGALMAAGLLAAGACGGGDDGEQARNAADAFTDFTVTLGTTGDIAQASDDRKNELKNNCTDLNDEIGNDDLGKFCDDLEEAVDDEDQAALDRLKEQFKQIEPAVRADIAEKVGDAVQDAQEDDQPLQGGDPGDAGDDNNDDDGVDNPLDDGDNPLDRDDTNNDGGGN